MMWREPNGSHVSNPFMLPLVCPLSQKRSQAALFFLRARRSSTSMLLMRHEQGLRNQPGSNFADYEILILTAKIDTFQTPSCPVFISFTPSMSYATPTPGKTLNFLFYLNSTNHTLFQLLQGPVQGLPMKMLILLCLCASVSFSIPADKAGLPRLPLDVFDFLFSESDP